MNIRGKLRVIGYDKDSLGELMNVETVPGFWCRMAGIKPAQYLFERWWKRPFWQHGREQCAPWMTRKLDDLRNDYEHENRIELAAHTVQSGVMPLAELEECGCGKAHRVGWICNSVYKDTL